MLVPEDLHYTASHEWVRIEGHTARLGITDYAQDALGDVVFVQTPVVGTDLESGAMMGEVESTKSVSELYTPVGGRVVQVNEDLADRPELLNQDPYGDGWICELEVGPEASGADGLLDAAAYSALTAH